MLVVERNKEMISYRYSFVVEKYFLSITIGRINYHVINEFICS
jgi:hypothetical protein